MNRVPTRTLSALLVLCLGLAAVAPATVALPVDAVSTDALPAESVSTETLSAGPVSPGPLSAEGSVNATSAIPPADVTYVESDITENTTWTAEGGPYRVVADVTVAEGATLAVEPGTSIQFASDISLVVAGNLSAEGTADAPVTLSTAPQAPDRVRWASLRYEGSANSRLSLEHVVLERATNGITVDSSAGRIRVSEATVRNVRRNGIRVVHDAGTPEIAVADSTFTDVGDRGIAVTPGRGTVGEFAVTSNSSKPGSVTEHQLALSPGVDTTMDAFRVSYRGHGDVSADQREYFRKFGLDLNNNGTIDRSLLPLVAGVANSGNAYEIRLRRAVTVPGDATVRVAYNRTENPRTYGSYPVAVDFRTNGVSQTAETTLPFDLRSSGDGPDRRSVETRAAGISVTGSTFESVGEQAVFVSADVTRRVRVADNVVSATGGSGIALRGRRVGGIDVRRNRISAVGADGLRLATRRVSNLDLRGNHVSGADAGIGLYARNENADGIRVTGNAITGSTTGVRVRHRVAHYAHHVSLTLADNAISDSDRRGVSVVVEAARLRGTVRENNVTGNGGAGVLLAGDTLSKVGLRNNTVAENAHGVRVRANRFVNSEVADNTIAENRGHGFSARTSLLVHNVSVAANRVLDNAGIGLNVDNELTHAGRVTLTRNVVAANAYGIRLAGAFGSRVIDNTVVFNTYGLGAPRRIPGYAPGTGIVVAEGDAGAIFRTGDVDEELVELVDDPQVEEQFRGRAPGDYTVVLRPNRSGYVWSGDHAALAVRSLSEDLPTGVVLGKGDEDRRGVVVSGNDVYGHDRGMVVNVSTLVDANTTARLFVDGTRTVLAERNYWGAETGPTHASIHPEGSGDRVVTRAGWVDFVPSASSPLGQRYHRPKANVSVSRGAATVGDSVVVSARASSDGDGRVAVHRFVVRGPDGNAVASSPIRSGNSNLTFEVEKTGRYTVSLVVADEMGVEGEAAATATVRVREQGATTTASEGDSDSEAAFSTATTARSSNATTTARTSGEAESGLLPPLSVFTTLGGLLGLICYLTALALGGFGVLRSVRRQGVPVSGKVINALAVVGVLVWVVFGLLGTGGLLAVGVGGGALWVALVALLWLAMG